MRELPSSWHECMIGDVTRIVAGGTPPSQDVSNFTSGDAGIPWITPADLSGYKQVYISHGTRSLTEIGFTKSSAKKMPAGSVLFSSRAPIGYVAIAANELSTNQGFKSFVLPDGINNHFIYYYLKYIKPVAEEMATGTTFKELSGAAAAKIPLIVAPSSEQKRIADKLDAVLARIDVCRDHLGSIPSILKRFRQSVLSAATSGKLTEDWRIETKINTGKMAFLGDLGQILAGQSPSVTEVNYEGKGEPYVTGPEQWDGKKILAHKWTEYPKRMAPDGSIFVTVKGAGVGKTFPGCRAAIGRDVYAFVPDINHNHHFVLLAIQSSVVGIVNKAKGLIPGLTKADIGEHEIYLPVIEEQIEIVRRVETLFAIADRMEARYVKARAQVEKLTPATLAKAFRGELVPHDPNDEPASALIERIRSTTSSKAKKIKTPRKNPMTKNSTESVKAIIRKMPNNRFSFDELRNQITDDYETLKDIVFALLSESEPMLRQVFDEKAQAMCFEKA